MRFLVSAEFADDARQNIEPWLDVSNPVWEGATPLGVYLSAVDKPRYERSDLAKLMALMQVPVSSDETLDIFCAAAMAARIGQLIDEAAGERAAAAALRKDFMQLQENFLAVEGFLNGALAPRFVLARQWDFSGNTIELSGGKTVMQAVPISGQALVAVDLWMVSGAVKISVLGLDGAEIIAPVLLTGSGWQRAQFAAIPGNTGVSLLIEAVEECEIGIALPSALPEFGEKPLALRLWKGLSGIALPEVVTSAATSGFVMPADFPKAESLGVGGAKYLEKSNILMVHTDYYGAAELVMRDVNLGSKCTAHIQNCGPDTLEVSLVQVASGAAEPRKYCVSAFLAPEAYMQAEVVSDGADSVDLWIKIKGQTSLDCLSLRGFDIG